MNCCKHKYLVIYRGDDTDFPGNQELIVELNTTRDLTGCSAHIEFQGFRQDFDEIPDDKKLRLVFPSGSTKQFALGAADAKLWLTYGSNDPKKIRTVENRIHIVVTNNINEAYDNDDPQAITVTIKGTDLTWDNIKNKPNLVKTVNGESPDESGDVKVTAEVEGAVQYDREQELTDAQKAQAQKNIGTFGKLPLRALPKYLHFLPFDDTYPADAQAFYDSIGSNRVMGGCSIVRKGGLVGGNFDYPYDDACSFAIKVSAGKGANADGSDRHASVGAAYLGTLLTENIVSSGVSTPLYRVLPGMTESGINDAGVYAKINVIPRDTEHDPVQSETRGLHALAVVRYVLDNFDNAADAAEYVAAHYYIPEGSADSYHWMIADATGTYVVDSGNVYDEYSAMTNFSFAWTGEYGTGFSRWGILDEGSGTVAELLSAVKFTNAYAEGWPWPDEFAGQTDAQGKIPYTETDRLIAWANAHVAPLLDANRKPAARGNGCWQTVHSAIYDIEKKTMAICVQEDFSKRYVFAVDQVNVEPDDTVTRTSSNPVKSSGIWSAIWGTLTAIPAGFSSLYDWCVAQLAGKRDKTDLTVYEASYSHWTWTSSDNIRQAWLDAANNSDLDGPQYEPGSGWSSWSFMGIDYVHPTRGNPDDLELNTIVEFDDEPGVEYHVKATRQATGTVPTSDSLAKESQLANKLTKPDESIEPSSGHFLIGDGNGGTYVDPLATFDRFDTVVTDISVLENGKANKVSGADAGNLASLDGNGDLADSGVSVDDGNVVAKYGSTSRSELRADGHIVSENSGLTTDYSYTIRHESAGVYTELYFPQNKVGTIALVSDIPQISATDPAFVSAVRNTPTSGMPEDMPTDWGTYGTVGAALAALAAFVKWAKAKIVAVIGNDGKPTDQFATDLLGKQVAISAMRYGLASTSATVKAADRTVTKVTLGTTAVTVTFPDADENGKTRDFLLRIDAASLATGGSLTITKPTGATIYGDAFPSPEATKQYLVAITETAANEFYVRTIEITIPTEG